jgi:hypothetical protein
MEVVPWEFNIQLLLQIGDISNLEVAAAAEVLGLINQEEQGLLQGAEQKYAQQELEVEVVLDILAVQAVLEVSMQPLMEVLVVQVG